MGEIAGVLKRRWPMAIGAALLAAAAAVLAFTFVGPTYKFTSAVLLLPPKITVSSDEVTKGNPLFYLGSLTQARDLVLGDLNSNNVQEQMKLRYPGTTYTADRDVLGSSPVVVVTVEGPNEVMAQQLSAYLTDQVPKALASLQDRLAIRENARISSAELNIDQAPETRNRAQLRGAIVAGGAVAALGAGLIAIVDGVMPSINLWRSQRSGKDGGGDAVADLPEWVIDSNPPQKPHVATENSATALVVAQPPAPNSRVD